jgi:hypothetical protein
VGLLCASAGRVGLNIGTLLSISVGLVLGSIAKKYRWEPEKTFVDDLIGKAYPCRKTRAPERDGKATIDWIVPSKRML